MKFAVPNVYRFLENHGYVYTVRDYKFERGDRVFVSGIGFCTRRFVGTVDENMSLDRYVAESGFDSVEAWKNTINKFITPDKKKYLYLVRRD